jgi:D-psicose/D-tagatose/L-ribulose 3-epimerase
LNPVRTSIHSFCLLPRWTTEAGIAAASVAAESGFGYLVVPLKDHTLMEPDRLAPAFEAAGIVPLATSNLAPGNDVSDTDPEIRRRGVEHHLDSLRIARDLGASHVGGALYGALHRYDTAPTSENWKAAVDSVQVVAAAAQTMGMTLAIEIVNRYENHLINTVESGLAFLDDAGCDNLFLHLDTFHMNIEETDPLDALRRALPRLGYFELDQNDRGMLSAGAIDFQPFLDLILRSDYAGWIGAEGFSGSVSAPGVAAGVAAWRPTYSSGDEFARDAARVISDLTHTIERSTL